jgi:acyl carrier protein
MAKTNRELILGKVKEILADQVGWHGVEIEAITEETHLENDLELDSLDIIEVCMSIEEKFDIFIPDEDIFEIGENGGTVEVVVDYLERLVL